MLNAIRATRKFKKRLLENIVSTWASIVHCTVSPHLKVPALWLWRLGGLWRVRQVLVTFTVRLQRTWGGEAAQVPAVHLITGHLRACVL